jgi:hypothetical protein
MDAAPACCEDELGSLVTTLESLTGRIVAKAFSAERAAGDTAD